MSTAESGIKHLTQEKLSKNDNVFLQGLDKWLEKARFGPPALKSSANTSKSPTEFEVCSDDECPKQWALLKKNVDLIKENPFRQWSIVRVTGPAPFKNTGPSYICPIRIIEGSPTVEGHQLKIGEWTYIKGNERVVITPALDFLFLLL